MELRMNIEYRESREFKKEDLQHLKNTLLEQLKDYIPYNEQEERDKAFIIDFINNNANAFVRDNNVAHMTASAWIVNKAHDKVLMCYHKIYDSWSWLGGHADGDTNLLNVAIREAKEESGIKNIRAVSDDIFSVEVLTVDGHVKKGKYVSSHLHLNVTYLLEADEDEELTAKEDENLGVRWFTVEEALKASTEPWFVKNVYSKLIEKQK